MAAAVGDLAGERAPPRGREKVDEDARDLAEVEPMEKAEAGVGRRIERSKARGKMVLIVKERRLMVVECGRIELALERVSTVLEIERDDGFVSDLSRAIVLTVLIGR